MLFRSLGAELRVLTPAGSNDGAGQLDMVRREAAGQASVLVIAPADCAGLERALAQGEAGCPVVTLESPLEGARRALEAAGVRTRLGETDLSGTGLAGLLKHPDLSAVMAFEPALTEQAAALKSSLGLDVPLYGVGVTAVGAAWLERGVISAAAAWSDFAVGYLAVEGALALARGERAEVEQPPFFIVRGADIYEPEYHKLRCPVTG